MMLVFELSGLNEDHLFYMMSMKKTLDNTVGRGSMTPTEAIYVF